MGTQETQDWFSPCIKSRKVCEMFLLARYKSGSTVCGQGLEYGLYSMSSKSWLVENPDPVPGLLLFPFRIKDFAIQLINFPIPPSISLASAHYENYVVPRQGQVQLFPA